MTAPEGFHGTEDAPRFDQTAADRVQVACAVFALCDRAADGIVDAGPVGIVPACERCATKLGYTLTRCRFMADAAGSGMVVAVSA